MLFALLTTVLSPSARRYFREIRFLSRIRLARMVSITFLFRNAVVCKDAPPGKWGDRRWQTGKRLGAAGHIRQAVYGLGDKRQAAQAFGNSIYVTRFPYFASPIDRQSPRNPFCKQLNPTTQENPDFIAMRPGSLRDGLPVAARCYPERIPGKAAAQGAVSDSTYCVPDV